MELMRWKPRDTTETIENEFGVVHLYGPPGRRPCAVGYHGKANKPDFNYIFPSEEQLRKHIEDFFAGLKAYAEQKAKWTAERNKPHTLKVGDILYASWGYDQTNIDFYQVFAVRGRVVDIRELQSTITEATGMMSGMCAPLPGEFKGEEIVKGKRPRGDNSIPWKSYADIHPWDGRPKYCSWYA